MTLEPMSIDEARLLAHYVAYPASRDPAAEIDRLTDAMTPGLDGRAPLTTALRELYDACCDVDEFWSTDPLTATDERTAAIEIVERLHVAGAVRLGAAFRTVAQSSPGLRVYLTRVGYLAD